MSRVVGTPMKPFGNGRAAQLGTEAALYAHAGLVARPDAFEHAKGFITLFGGGTFELDLLERLGTRFILVTPGLAFKLFPVCSSAQPGTEALVTLIEEERLDRRGWSRMSAARSRKTLRPASSSTARRRWTEAQFSMNFALACILVYGELGVAQLTEEVFVDRRIQEAMGKVELILNKELAKASDLGPAFPEAALVTVTIADGRTFSKLNKGATGTPVNPMPDGRLDQKLFDCAGPGNGRGLCKDAAIPNQKRGGTFQVQRAVQRRRLGRVSGRAIARQGEFQPKH